MNIVLMRILLIRDISDLLTMGPMFCGHSSVTKVDIAERGVGRGRIPPVTDPNHMTPITTELW